MISLPIFSIKRTEEGSATGLGDVPLDPGYMEKLVLI